MSPVTQVALVEVNRASRKGMPRPSTVISGSINRPVPDRMRNRKEQMKSVAGWKRNRGRALARSDSSITSTTRKYAWTSHTVQSSTVSMPNGSSSRARMTSPVMMSLSPSMRRTAIMSASNACLRRKRRGWKSKNHRTRKCRM